MIYNESFENLNDNNVNELLGDFIDVFNTAIHFNDKIFQDELLKSFEFSFGNFFADLVYGVYDDIIEKKPLKNLKQLIHQELQNIFSSIPSGGEEIKNRKDFLNTSTNNHIGLLGLNEIDYSCDNNLKVFNNESWINWKSYFYSNNTEFIKWGDNEYFPNIQISNFILSLENDSNSNITDINAEKAKKYCNELNQRGYNRGELMSKAETVGKKIAKINFYTYLRELSVRETRRTGSRRTIFKIIKNGRNLYLSIDYHKCFCFEVCDHRGKHLCELRFDGLLNGQNTQDESGNHDIKLN